MDQYDMRVALINNLFKPLDRGGAENIIDITAAELIRRGHVPIVITTRPYFSRVDFVSSYKIYRLPSLYLSLEKMPYWVRFFWHIWDLLDVFTAIRIMKLIKNENIDVVMTNNLTGVSPYLLRSLRKFSGSHLHFLHDIQLLHPSGLMLYGKESVINTWGARLYQKYTAFIARSVKNIVSPSEWLRDLHYAKEVFSPGSITIIRNPSPAPGKIEKKSDIRQGFLFVGQIEEHKGAVFLIRAWRHNNMGAKTNHCLKIAGAGSKYDELKELTRDDSSVVWLGRLGKLEVEKEMAQASLLIVPSLCYENSPMVIYEAVARDLPFIASDIGGIGELAKEFGGVLFTPGDQDDLCRKLEGHKPEYGYGNKYDKDLEEYSVQRFFDKMSVLFK